MVNRKNRKDAFFLPKLEEMQYNYGLGSVAEWLKALVLKTSEDESPS